MTSTCDAKYPDSQARCSLPPRHEGGHCSQAAGLMWPNLESLPLRKGSKVRLGKREATVVNVERLGTPDRTAVLLLDSGKEKRVMLRTAPLRQAASKRGRAEDAAQFRRCLGCGEIIETEGTG